MHFVMIFVDGLGLGSKENNPIIYAHTPNIDNLLGGHKLFDDRNIKYNRTVMYALDTGLGVEGIPQSATGQTTLWTGINAAKEIGCHLNAYPNKQLKKIIEEYSIFKQLRAKGIKTAFANTFTQDYEELISKGFRRHSASTLCALAGGIPLRRRSDLLAGKSVYQDITNEIFRKRGEDAPLFSPYQAGANLGKLILEYDFTLFESFQTDSIGHRLDFSKAVNIIERLDQFLGGFFAVINSLNHQEHQVALILTSDHGNIEDLSTREHTTNKVPAICWSNYDLVFPILERLEDVTPTVINIILNHYNKGTKPNE